MNDHSMYLKVFDNLNVDEINSHFTNCAQQAMIRNAGVFESRKF